MRYLLIVIVSLIGLTSCEDYSTDIATATELLVSKGYSNINYKYSAIGDSTLNIRALCNYESTLVFEVQDKNKKTSTIAFCINTKKIHLLSKALLP